jgi:hypothetical protein
VSPWQSGSAITIRASVSKLSSSRTSHRKDSNSSRDLVASAASSDSRSSLTNMSATLMPEVKISILIPILSERSMSVISYSEEVIYNELLINT